MKSVTTPAPAWLDVYLSHFSELLQQGRMPHALLVTGLPGVGKSAFADRLAALLVCEEAAGSDACGHCSACHLFAAGTHPDLFRVSPEEDSSVIKIDQVRRLAAGLALSHHGAGTGRYPQHQCREQPVKDPRGAGR
jgi:DNA polymerase-3 subunit delta'